MGYYIDPKGQSKEQWLAAHATPVTQKQAEGADFDSTFPIILIDNGGFTAAAIAHARSEFEALTRHDDRRPRKFFLASREKILPFCGILEEGQPQHDFLMFDADREVGENIYDPHPTGYEGGYVTSDPVEEFEMWANHKNPAYHSVALVRADGVVLRVAHMPQIWS